MNMMVLHRYLYIVNINRKVMGHKGQCIWYHFEAVEVVVLDNNERKDLLDAQIDRCKWHYVL